MSKKLPTMSLKQTQGYVHQGLKAMLECASHAEEVDTILYEADYDIIKRAFDYIQFLESNQTLSSGVTHEG